MGRTRYVKGLAKNAKGVVATGARKVLVTVKNVRFSKVLNRKWQDVEYDVAGKKFRLDDDGMDHILRRHHPKYWDGRSRTKQDFFPEDMSIDEIKDLISTVMRQNRDLLERKGTTGMYQIEGVVNGVRYRIGFHNGRIGQFHPL